MSNLFFVAKKKKSIGKKSKVSKKGKKSPVKKSIGKKRPSRRFSGIINTIQNPLPSDIMDSYDDKSDNKFHECEADLMSSRERVKALEKDLETLKRQTEKCSKDLNDCNSKHSKTVEHLRKLSGKAARGVKSDADYDLASADMFTSMTKAEQEAREKRRAERKAKKGSYQPPSIAAAKEPLMSGYQPLAGGDDMFAGMFMHQFKKSKRGGKKSSKKSGRKSKKSGRKSKKSKKSARKSIRKMRK